MHCWMSDVPCFLLDVGMSCGNIERPTPNLQHATERTTALRADVCDPYRVGGDHFRCRSGGLASLDPRLRASTLSGSGRFVKKMAGNSATKRRDQVRTTALRADVCDPYRVGGDHFRCRSGGLASLDPRLMASTLSGSRRSAKKNGGQIGYKAARPGP